MKGNYLVLFCVFCIGSSFNPIPDEDWDSGRIDLGNGGDKTFYLLVKCKTCITKPPLVMWLTGGPGGSSTPTNFVEIGPYQFNKTYQFERNPWAWNLHVDMMYVDNPVGVPFSIAKSKDTLCRDENCVARNLYTMLTKFMEKHPEYIGRQFYLAGESYAGHYIPYLGSYLTKANNSAINFAGGIIGNPFFEGYLQTSYLPEFLLVNNNITTIGFILLRAVNVICEIARESNITLLKESCDFSFFKITELAGIKYLDDITKNGTDPVWASRFIQFINSTETKKAFGAEGSDFGDYIDARKAMFGDAGLALSANIGYCLDQGKKFLFWFGDKDPACQWIGGLQAMLKLPWKEIDGFKKAPEVEWKDKNAKALGTMKKYKQLIFAKVFNAGHTITDKQPGAAYELLLEFLKQ